MKISFAQIKFDKTHLNSWAIIFMVFFFPLIGVLNFVFDIRGGNISYCLRLLNILISIFVLTKFIQGKDYKVKAEIVLLVFYWVLYFLRLVLDLEVYQIHLSTLKPKTYYYIYGFFITFLPMLAAAFIYPIDFKHLLNRLRKVLKLFNVAILILYIKELFMGNGVIFRFYLTRPDHDYLDPITIGVYAGLLLITYYDTENKKIKDYLFILIGLVNLIIAGSRGPVLFLGLITLSIFLITPQLFFKNMYDFFKKSYYIFIIVLFYIYFSPANFSIYNRMANFSEDQSSIKRFSILEDVKEQFLSSPFTGSHFLVVNSEMYSHNIFLDILLSNGMLGLIILLPLFFIFLKTIILNKFQSTFLIIALFLFLNTLTSGGIYNAYEFWIVFVIVLANKNQFITNIKQ